MWAIEEYEIARTVTYRPWENAGRTFSLSTYPYLDIVMNDACNARCQFCIGHLVHDNARADIETFRAKIKFAVEQMGVKEVLLLGGEATINRDLIDMIWHLKSHHGYALQKICLTTNGHRLVTDEAYGDSLFRSGLTHVNLSLMSLDPDRQREIHGARTVIDEQALRLFRRWSLKYHVHFRINVNVWRGNHDALEDMISFYLAVSPYCDSVKFSPLLKTDAFSTVNEVTQWNRAHCLSDTEYDALWSAMEYHHADIPILRNRRTFGFVEYSMILLPVPIILNYNQRGRLMQRVVESHEINNVKLLPTGDLSLSWNREMSQYFLTTE